LCEQPDKAGVPAGSDKRDWTCRFTSQKCRCCRADKVLSAAGRSKLHEWIDQVGKLGIESYDENENTGRALHALRVEWGNCLETLRGLEPNTVEGANEKLNAAQVFLTFSCEADGSAAELLALATRELDHVNANLRVSDRAQISRPVNTQGPRGWFERLTRRA
jgi:hypothetical protein